MRRGSGTFPTLAAVLGAMLALVTRPASATTFADITVEELVRASDLVVVGRVETVESFPVGPAGQPGIHTRAIVQVAETLRGDARTLVEVWVHGGRLGDRIRVVPGQATFRRGEVVTLFLFQAGGGLWPTGMGRGKWVRSDAGWTPSTPATTETHSHTGGLSAAELRERVQP